MIRSIWLITGKVLYWVMWPFLFIFIRGSSRTRVLVIYDNKLLAIKGWLGSGGWQLPGGGIKRNESPIFGAMRELTEETGLVVSDKELQLLLDGVKTQQNGISYQLYAYQVTLDAKPSLKLHWFEVSDSRWIKVSEFVSDELIKCNTDIQQVVQAFYKKCNLLDY